MPSALHQHQTEVLVLVPQHQVFIAQGEQSLPSNCAKQTETEARFDRLCGCPWHVLSTVSWLAVLLESYVIFLLVSPQPFSSLEV